MVNKVILIGNLGKDPEVRHLESGSVVAKFSVATNENYRDKNGEWQTLTEWHNIVVWRGLAERAERSLKKGMQVYIEGKLTTRKWQDSNGNDRYTTDVVANYLRILEKRDSSGEYTSNNFPGEEDEAKSYRGDSSEKSVFNLSDQDKEKPAAQDFSGVEDDLPF
ncbi:single-stranded DNA-binding protein [Portibacter marinus]|uniref:single-stranded DNA-binding protein n=1 Tax=Portibacter marinus TaxID=2898660 RepID=UPI001F4527CE|nr:single-stranded DNA-binding protein [Portibacter marinus]